MIDTNSLYKIVRIKQVDSASVKANEEYIKQMYTFVSNLPSLSALKAVNIQKPEPYILHNKQEEVHTMSHEEIFLNAQEINKYVLCRKKNG